MKCKRTSDGRSFDHHTLQVMRLQAVKAVREGQPVATVAAAYGLNVRTVFRWLSCFANGGQNALLAKPIPGRPPKISAQEMRWLFQVLSEDTPQHFGFPFGLWTLSLIGELIKREFGKSLSLASVSRVTKLLGFVVQRPLHAVGQKNPAQVRRWMAEAYPKIRAEARRKGASIYFADEVDIHSDYSSDTTETGSAAAAAESAGNRGALSMISAVSAQGEFRFMVHDEPVSSLVFKNFLERLLIGAKRPIFLVVGGNPKYKTKLIESYVESTDGRLKLFYLPTYSQHRKPDRRVLAHVKREPAKSEVHDKGILKRLVVAAIRRCQAATCFVGLLFRQPECQVLRELL